MKKLIVTFTQCYLEPGASYSFSNELIAELQRRISKKFVPSDQFLMEYPAAGSLDFGITASSKVKKGKIHFGEFDRKSKEHQFGLCLPYSSGDKIWKRRSICGLRHLIDALDEFVSRYGMDVPDKWNQREVIELVDQDFERYFYRR